MIKYYNKLSPIFGALLIIYVLTGCGDYRSDSHLPASDNYLIKVGDRVATKVDFNMAFEFMKTAYSHSALQDPNSCREAKLRLLSELIEEMVILERAKELDIKVSDSEFDEAVAQIKGDYDDEAFAQTLLEQAISYDLWEKELGKRLLLEKVVERELKHNIVITSQDISNYYEKNYIESDELPSQSIDPDNSEVGLNRIIVKQLRRKKAEEAYKPWIEKLKKRYLVKINKKEWEKISKTGLGLN